MPWRFRKSVRVGRFFRINLSKGGVGYSAGVPGTGLSWYQGPRSEVSPGCVLGLVVAAALGLVVVWGGCGGKDWSGERKSSGSASDRARYDHARQVERDAAR